MVDRVRFYFENYEKVFKESCVLEISIFKEKVVYEFFGVVVNILVWNYLYFVFMNVFVVVLLIGNVVFYKLSEYVILIGMEIINLLYEVGVLKNVFVMIIGKGEIGVVVVLLKGLGGLFFMGLNKMGLEIVK